MNESNEEQLKKALEKHDANAFVDKCVVASVSLPLVLAMLGCVVGLIKGQHSALMVGAIVLCVIAFIPTVKWRDILWCAWGLVLEEVAMVALSIYECHKAATTEERGGLILLFVIGGAIVALPASIASLIRMIGSHNG